MLQQRAAAIDGCALQEDTRKGHMGQKTEIVTVWFKTLKRLLFIGTEKIKKFHLHRLNCILQKY